MDVSGTVETRYVVHMTAREARAACEYMKDIAELLENSVAKYVKSDVPEHERREAWHNLKKALDAIQRVDAQARLIVRDVVL
jgi:hypothetical protein